MRSMVEGANRRAAAAGIRPFTAFGGPPPPLRATAFTHLVGCDREVGPDFTLSPTGRGQGEGATARESRRGRPPHPRFAFGSARRAPSKGARPSPRRGEEGSST